MILPAAGRCAPHLAARFARRRLICPACGDAGRIEGWQGTPWDRFDEAFGDDEDEAIADPDVARRPN